MTWICKCPKSHLNNEPNCLYCGAERYASLEPIDSITPDRHALLKPVIEYGDSLGFLNNKERESFVALVDAVDLRLNWLERQAK